MSDEELNEWVEELLGKGTADYSREALSEALEANRELRDDNFVNPEAVLVFTEATGCLEEVELWELPLRYPLEQPGQRWSYSDLGQVAAAKATLHRQSKVANELAEEDPEATPLCGTVVLVDPLRPGPLCWCRVTAAVLPGQD